MASSSSLALRRLLSSTVVPSSIRPVAASRLFNTNAVRSCENEDDGVDKNRRLNRPVSRFSDFFDLFARTRSLREVLNVIDQIDESLVVQAKRAMVASGGVRRGWDIKEKDDALYLRIDMPGLSKEDVKLSLEQNTLVIKGEGKTEEGEEEDVSGVDGRKFSSRFGLPEKVYKMDEIKAEMKNGVLKVVVPKMKEEERNNVRHIHVD